MRSKTLNLDPERWARVEALFDEAAEMAPAERAQFLGDACKDDLELRNYVGSLLESDMAADTLVKESIRDVLTSVMPPLGDGTGNVGMRIGAYRVVQTIGTGGMGVVYLAERADDQFEQQVAIKVVRQRLLDPDIEKRLLAERQILADLDHPNIARLFDGGTTPDGTPYLVMEYIEGLPIDEYCDRHELTIEQRIELFRTVCNSIHHAHQNLVVHRDIKPSNILVTADGAVKLLDFGIARLIDAGGADAGLTRAGAVILTPENASPEQVRNEPVTTATDTYALGILLYRLLTGRPPYLVDMKVPTEIPRIICSTEPLLPSIKVRQPCDGDLYPEDRLRSPDAIARARGTTVDRLSRRLRGDIDNIVKTALRKEPERRYRTVHEFAEDLKLHLGSHPVLARPDTWYYRASLFLKRHTVGAAMSALLFLLLVVFAATMSVQNRRIAEERDTATEIATFLEEIFMEPDPGNARGASITAREILKKGAARIATQLDERPAIQATLMSTIGRVYFNLGEYGSSIEMLEEALRIRQEDLGDEDLDLARTKDELAAALTRKAEYARAEELLHEALEYNHRKYGTDSAAVAGNLYNRAEVFLATGETDRAEGDARESVRVFTALGDAHAAEIAEGKSLLARILQRRNELDEAEVLMRDAIRIVEERLGEDHPLLAYYAQNLAALLQSKGEVEAAEKMYDQAIAITRKVLGEDHSLLGDSFVTLGQLFQQREEYDAAEKAFRDALRVDRNARGENHPFVGYDHAVLGTLMHEIGRLDEAEVNLRKALEIYDESLGPEHQYVASALTPLCAVLTADGRAQEAESLIARAIEIRRSDYDESHPLFASTLSVAGYNLTALERYDEAEKLLLDSYATLREQLGDDDRRTRRVREWIVALYAVWQKPEKAAKYQVAAESTP